MGEEIFRKKSLDKVKSPENLDDYIQVSNPGVWLVLVSVIVLLAGACVWGIFGHIDSTVDTSVRVNGGTAVCAVAEEPGSSVQEGMVVRFDEYSAVVAEIERDGGDLVCTLRAEQPLPEGVYPGKIVISTINPIHFVLN